MFGLAGRLDAAITASGGGPGIDSLGVAGTWVEKARNVENHISDDHLVFSRGLRGGKCYRADPQPRRAIQPQPLFGLCHCLRPDL